jgi:hypothetical protein
LKVGLGLAVGVAVGVGLPVGVIGEGLPLWSGVLDGAGELCGPNVQAASNAQAATMWKRCGWSARVGEVAGRDMADLTF